MHLVALESAKCTYSRETSEDFGQFSLRKVATVRCKVILHQYDNPYRKPSPMRSFVYKSVRKPDTYLYLRDEGAFDVVPGDLLERLGPPVFVIELLLDPSRPLAREKVETVIDHLSENGWHLQLPPAAIDSDRLA